MATMSTYEHDEPKPRASGSRRSRAPHGSGLSLDVRISKALSYTLRHGAAKEGLSLREDGYARVPALLALSKFRSLGLTFAQLQRIVAENDKQRYTLIHSAEGGEGEGTGEGWLIRANQGHSIAISSEALQLAPLLGADLPPTLVHGSFYVFVRAILDSGGLKRMRRTHIHLAAADALAEGAGGGVISGMRRDAEVVFLIDARRARDQGGLKFWKSANEVVLTEGDANGTLALDYIVKVEDRKCGRVIWEDGKLVGDLPEVKGRAPKGKEHVLRGGKKGGDRGKEGEAVKPEGETGSPAGGEGGRGGKKGGKGRKKGQGTGDDGQNGDLRIDAGDI